MSVPKAVRAWIAVTQSEFNQQGSSPSMLNTAGALSTEHRAAKGTVGEQQLQEAMAAAAALSDAALATACARESLHVLQTATATEGPGELSHVIIMAPVTSELGRNSFLFDTYRMMQGSRV